MIKNFFLPREMALKKKERGILLEESLKSRLCVFGKILQVFLRQHRSQARDEKQQRQLSSNSHGSSRQQQQQLQGRRHLRQRDHVIPLRHSYRRQEPGVDRLLLLLRLLLPRAHGLPLPCRIHLLSRPHATGRGRGRGRGSAGGQVLPVLHRRQSVRRSARGKRQQQRQRIQEEEQDTEQLLGRSRGRGGRRGESVGGVFESRSSALLFLLLDRGGRLPVAAPPSAEGLALPLLALPFQKGCLVVGRSQRRGLAAGGGGGGGRRYEEQQVRLPVQCTMYSFPRSS